jgi:hypothetical protein
MTLNMTKLYNNEKGYGYDPEHPVESMLNKAVSASINVLSPMGEFYGTEYEDDAASIMPNLYNKDGSIDYGIAADLVALAQVANYSEYMSFALLYKALKPSDRRRFEEIGKKVITDNKAKEDGESDKKAEKVKTEEKKESAKQETVAAPEQEKKPQENKKSQNKPVVQQQPAQAANQVGFNINNFLNHNQNNQQPNQQVPIKPFVPPVIGQPQAQMQQQAVVQPQQNQLPVQYDPRPDLNAQQKVEQLKKNYKFIEGKHNSIGVSQLNALLMLLNNGELKSAVKKNNAKCRANNIFMTEVEMPDQYKNDFDFAFHITTKDPKHPILVLFNSNQFYDSKGGWLTKLKIEVAHNH